MRSLLLVTLLACGSSTTPATKPTTINSPLDAGLLPVVQVQGEKAPHRPLEERMRELKIHAVSIAVFDNYELVWSKAYGHADAEGKVLADEHTTFLAGSISKSVNALGQLKAVEAGVLSLDGPINDTLKGWKLEDNELTKAKPVTLRMLLSHTAGTTVHGFRGYAPSEPVPTVLEILDGKKPANSAPIRVDLAPGTKFRYSGGGTTISQFALAEKLGKPYPQILDELVLEPLGMTESSYDQQLTPARLQRAAVGYDSAGNMVDGKRFIYPEMAAAGLWTTPTDLAKFFLEIAKARAGKSKLVSKQIAEQMTTKVMEIGQGPDAIGLGVFLTERNGVWFFGHGGADIGFQANSVVSMEGGRGLVIMTNSENGFRLFPEIERTIIATLGWPGADPPVTRVAMAAAERMKLVGRYDLPNGPYEIIERGGKLLGRRPFGDGDELIPIAPDKVIGSADRESLQSDPGGLKIITKQGSVVAPRATADHPLFLVEIDRFDDAVAALKAMKDLKREEDLINQIGYGMVDRDPVKAAKMLRLNVVVFPDSANAHDSYADALGKAGKKQEAIAEFEQVLVTLEADPRIPPGDKPLFKKRANDEIAKLKR